MIAPASQPERRKPAGRWLPWLLVATVVLHGALAAVNVFSGDALSAMRWEAYARTRYDAGWKKGVDEGHAAGYDAGYRDCQRGVRFTDHAECEEEE